MNVYELPVEIVVPGESAVIRWPAAGTWAVGQVFRRTTGSAAWTLDGTVDGAGAVTASTGAMLVNQAGVQSDAARLSIPWTALELWAPLTDVGNSVFAAAYDVDGRLLSGLVFELPVPTLNDVAGLIARDQRYLDALVVARAEATSTNGILEIDLPDGRREKFRSPASLTALINDLDARLNILRRAKDGHQFVGTAYR